MNMFCSVDKILRPSYFQSHRLDKREQPISPIVGHWESRHIEEFFSKSLTYCPFARRIQNICTLNTNIH